MNADSTSSRENPEAGPGRGSLVPKEKKSGGACRVLVGGNGSAGKLDQMVPMGMAFELDARLLLDLLQGLLGAGRGRARSRHSKATSGIDRLRLGAEALPLELGSGARGMARTCMTLSSG